MERLSTHSTSCYHQGEKLYCEGNYLLLAFNWLDYIEVLGIIYLMSCVCSIYVLCRIITVEHDDVALQLEPKKHEIV
jgi:hypothetical protein